MAFNIQHLNYMDILTHTRILDLPSRATPTPTHGQLIPHCPVSKELFMTCVRIKKFFHDNGNFNQGRASFIVGIDREGARMLYYKHSYTQNVVDAIREELKNEPILILPSVYSKDCAWNFIYPGMVFGFRADPHKPHQARVLLVDETAQLVPTLGSGPYNGYPAFGYLCASTDAIYVPFQAEAFEPIMRKIIDSAAGHQSNNVVNNYEFF